MSGFVQIEREDGVAIVRLHRPERQNAFHQQFWEELRIAGLQLTDSPPQVAILTGSDTVFSAGMDLNRDNPLIGRIERLQRNGDTYALTELINRLRGFLATFARVNCPVIAAIEGPCIGAGFQLALFADLRIASREAIFALPEVRFGLVPDLGGMVRLHQLIGETRTAELVLTGRTVTPDTLERWGIVNQVVEPGTTLGTARELAATIRKNSRHAVRNALLTIRQLSNDSEAFHLESAAGARAIQTGDLGEGLLAFMQKREASWD